LKEDALTKMMKAIVWDGGQWPAGLTLREFPRPTVRPGWVLVKNMAAGICGSDLHYLDGQTRSFIPDSNLPAVLGHENAGVVAEVPPGVTHLKPGDRVAVEPLHGCLELGRLPICAPCAAGQYHICERGLTHVGIPLVEMLPGGYGEYSIVHESRLFKIPDEVSYEAAALIDVLAVGVHALAVGQSGPGDSVTVLGSGVIGIDLIQCLKAWGVTKIYATAKYGFQGDAAREAGADEVILLQKDVDVVEEVRRLTNGRGVDAVYEGVGGRTDVINQAVKMCRPGGRVIMTGIFDGERPVDLLTMLFQEVHILSSNSYSTTGLKRDYQIAVDLLASGRVRHDFVVTHRYPLTQWRDAIETAFDKKGSGCLRSVMFHDS